MLRRLFRILLRSRLVDRIQKAATQYMDTGFWAEIARGLFNRRGVTTLMALTGRSAWILGSTAIATLASAGGELSTTRLWVLAALGTIYVFLHVAAYMLGMCLPKRFHFGAQELMKERELEKQSPSRAEELPNANVPGKSGGTPE